MDLVFDQVNQSETNFPLFSFLNFSFKVFLLIETKNKNSYIAIFNNKSN